jgi:citrate lyase gamma subunit
MSQAELGVAVEVGAEYQEEGAKVQIHAADVKVIDRGRVSLPTRDRLFGTVHRTAARGGTPMYSLAPHR